MLSAGYDSRVTFLNTNDMCVFTQIGVVIYKTEYDGCIITETRDVMILNKTPLSPCIHNHDNDDVNVTVTHNYQIE